MAERVRATEAWIEGHEKICGQRYALLLGVISFGGALILLVASYGLGTIRDTQSRQIQLLESLSAQVQQHTPAAPLTPQAHP